MTAIIVVAPGAFTALAAPDGRFTLDLPPGRYRMTALSERASPVSVEATSTQGASTAPELTLDESAVGVRAAQEQVREGLSGGRVPALTSV